MRLIVTNYSSAVDLGVMLGRVAICFKAGQEDYGKQCTRGVRHMKWYLPQLLWPGTQEVAWRLTGGGGQCLQGASRHASTPPARDGRTAFGVEKGGICPALELPGWTSGEPGEPGTSRKWCTIRHCWWAKTIYDNSWSATSPGFTLKSE